MRFRFPALPRFAFSSASAILSRRNLHWFIIAFMLLTLFGYDRGLLRLIGLMSDRATLRNEMARLETRCIELDNDLKRYTTDPFTIEKIIREELDWGKRGERVYRFPVQEPR